MKYGKTSSGKQMGTAINAEGLTSVTRNVASVKSEKIESFVQL